MSCVGVRRQDVVAARFLGAQRGEDARWLKFDSGDQVLQGHLPCLGVVQLHVFLYLGHHVERERQVAGEHGAAGQHLPKRVVAHFRRQTENARAEKRVAGDRLLGRRIFDLGELTDLVMGPELVIHRLPDRIVSKDDHRAQLRGLGPIHVGIVPLPDQGAQ
jgi:hypothetical protein